MGEQRAAPRPPRAQLPRHGAQPVAARCGARPARGWSPCRESGDPLGWEVTALLIPAHSLCPRPVWSGARGGLWGHCLRAFWLLRETSVWHPGQRVDTSLCCAGLLEAPLVRVGSGRCTRAGLVPLFPPRSVGAPGCSSVPRALETGLEGGDLVLPLCRFPRGWRESSCKLLFDSVHTPGSPAFLSGRLVLGPADLVFPSSSPSNIRVL